MSKKFKNIAATSVTVRHPETQETVWFHPGDEIPEWACEVITNDAVFAQSKEEASELIAVAEEAEALTPAVEWDTPNYDDLSADELKALLEERGLSTTGNKTVLVARLEESDVVLS